MHSALNDSGNLISRKVAHHRRWVQRNQRTARQVCRHYFLDANGPQKCFSDGECGNCPFDEMITAVRARYEAGRRTELITVEGFALQSDAYLHPGHMWLQRYDRSEAIVGLDQFASSLIGPPDQIEMPANGTMVHRGNPLVTVTRQGKSAHLLAPISGMVVAANTYLKPRRLLQRRKGAPNTWMVRLHSNHMRHALKDLFTGKRLQSFLQREVQRLFGDIEAIAGPLTADGGHLGDDIYGSLPDLGWDALAARYLRN